MNGTLAALASTNSLFFSPAPQPPSRPASRSASSASFARRASVKSSVQTYPETAVRKPKAPSLYEVLRVSRNASPAQIKSAYRTLAKTYHPDASSQSSDGRDFIEINKAYLTLSDPASRALYDMKLGFENTGSFVYSGRVASDRTGFYPGPNPSERDAAQQTESSVNSQVKVFRPSSQLCFSPEEERNVVVLCLRENQLVVTCNETSSFRLVSRVTRLSLNDTVSSLFFKLFPLLLSSSSCG
uniref:J domain-containing protein n=1 Tax=Kalanchoe fedtschenkoi TaxID=63787 RepID=A0A7N0U1X8_KALFE